jgi:serine O-acetyltransferase
MGILGDIRCAIDRDPAARNPVEVLLAYPGLHALWTHRVSHWMWNQGLHTPSRVLSHAARVATGVEIHPAARIGDGVFIDHGTGIVIGETAEVGDGCTIYQGATLGGTSLEPGKRHPTLGRNVVVGAGAKILGPVSVGDNARIGANSVVLHDVKAGTAVVGVPGQVISRSRPERPPLPERENDLPDAIGATLVSLVGRVAALEQATTGHTGVGPHVPQDGVWAGEDFVEVDYVI